MDKSQFLALFRQFLAQGTITREEILAILTPNESSPVSGVSAPVYEQSVLLKHRQFDAATIISLIGTGIVVVGVLFLVVQHWQDFTLPVRLMITLGFACACYFASVVLSVFKIHAPAAFWLYVLSTFVFPLGVGLWFDAAGILSTEYGVALLSFFVLAQHLLYFGFFRTTASVLFSALSFSWLFFSFTNYAYFSAGLQIEDFTLYRVLLLGISYLLFSYGIAEGAYRTLSTALYRIGLIGILASTLFLGKYSPYQNVGWEVLFPFLAVGLIALGIQFRIREFFVLPALGIMVYVAKIGFEYFSDSIGWPLTLIFTGFVLVVLGVGLVRFRKEYFMRPS